MESTTSEYRLFSPEVEKLMVELGIRVGYVKFYCGNVEEGEREHFWGFSPDAAYPTITMRDMICNRCAGDKLVEHSH